MNKRVYIKIPAGRNAKEQMVPVDPSTLSLGVLTQLYELSSRFGSPQYLPLLGTETWVSTGLDPEELLQLWQEFIDQVQHAVADQTGAASDFTNEMLKTMSDIAKLVREISEGKLAAASRTLQSIGFGMVQASAVASTELTRLENLAVQHAGLAETMVGIVVDQDERTVAEAEGLALVIDEGLTAYRVLTRYETSLNTLLSRVEAKGREWEGLSSDNSQLMREHRRWLAADETGFCTRASHYLITPNVDAAEAIAEAVTEARQRVQLIRERVVAAQHELVTTRVTAEAALSPHFSVDHQLQMIRKCREEFERARKAGVNAFSLITGLINNDEYAEWEATLADPRWQSLHEVGVRLRDKAETVRRLLNARPHLSESTENMLARTMHYIERLEAALAEFGVELDAAEADQGEASKEGLDREVDADRLAELYDMMLAIGAVKYCGPEQLRLGTPNSMLDILLRLGKLTAEELELYKGPLEKRLDADSVFLESGSDRLAAWQETEPSKAHWLKVKQRRGRSIERFPMWKLVEQARDKGLSLCLKYHLDPLDIAQASEARKVEKRKAQ